MKVAADIMSLQKLSSWNCATRAHHNFTDFIYQFSITWSKKPKYCDLTHFCAMQITHVVMGWGWRQNTRGSDGDGKSYGDDAGLGMISNTTLLFNPSACPSPKQIPRRRQHHSWPLWKQIKFAMQKHLWSDLWLATTPQQVRRKSKSKLHLFVCCGFVVQ